MSQILRFLPNDQYQAALNANAPSGANPFATVQDITITDDRVPRGTGSGIEDGTWENVGNDFRPVNASSNLGGTAAANRISTVYLASTINHSGILGFQTTAGLTQRFLTSGTVELNRLNGGLVNIGAPPATTSKVNIHESLRVSRAGGGITTIIAQNSNGGSQVQSNASNGAAGLVVAVTAGVFDSTLSFRYLATTRTIMGYDASANYFRMGTTVLTGGTTWFENDFNTNSTRFNNPVSVAGSLAPVGTKFFVRGTGNTSGTFTIDAQRLATTRVFGVRDDGMMFSNTSATQISGVGGAVNIRGIIAEHSSAVHAIEAGYGLEFTSTPTVDGTGRPTGLLVTGLKTGAFEVFELIGIRSEANNVGTGNFDVNSVAGMFGLRAQSANQASGSITIANSWALDTNTYNVTGVGNTATYTNFGGLNIRFDNSTRATITNMIGVKVNDPVNVTGATVTNTYVLLADANTLGTNNYGFFINGTGTRNHIAGNLTIGENVAASVARFFVEGTGNTSGTATAFFRNSSNVPLFYLRDDLLSMFGTATQSNVLGVPRGIYAQHTTTDSTGNNVGYAFNFTANPDVNNVRTNVGLHSRVIKSNVVNTTTLTGIVGQARNGGGGTTVEMIGMEGLAWTTAGATVTRLFGGQFNAQTQGTGTVTDFGSIRLVLEQSLAGSTITNMYHIRTETPANTGGTVVNTYGIYLSTNEIGTTLNYGIYQAGANTVNGFNGTMAIGALTVVNSQLEVTGDIEVIGAAGVGLVVEDRTTNNRRRMYLDNGVWSEEAA